MSSRIILNVPRIAYFIKKESFLTPFIGSLYATLQSQGENWEYSDILAMSGAGNRLRWMPGRWDPSNVDILHCEEEPFAPHFRVLKAIGWIGEVKVTKPISNIEGPFVDEESARKDIVSSIDRGIPVVAIGVIGPPECCVVFGYEDDGEKLAGWNYFQTDEGYDPEKPFIKKDWFKDTWGYILLKEKTRVPSARESGLEIFKAIVDHAYKGEVRGAKVGFSAWEAMLNQLENDDFSQLSLLPPGGIFTDDASWQNSVKGRFFVYCDALCQIHERGVALSYYKKLSDEVPEWRPELEQAISAWQECANYGGFLWKYMSMDNAGLEKFRSLELRKTLADEGRRAMGKDIEAISHIKRILEREK